MHEFNSHRIGPTWFAAVLLALVAAGCSGSRDPVLGGGGATGGVVPPPVPPAVTAVMPLPDAVGVATNNPTITATFSEPVAAIAGGASFTVTCATPCVNPTGTVTLDSTNTVATYTVTPATALAPLTLYTATVTGAVSLATGLALPAPYVWQFTTAALPVPPTVTAALPVDNAMAVPINASASATFSEAMAPIAGAASFTLTCAAPCANPTGSVALDGTHRIATFTPAAVLTPSTLYTATVTGAISAATGLALVDPFVWHFTTGATADVTRPTVTVTVPVTTAPGPTPAVPSNTAITATFSEDMAPGTINAASVTVTCAAPCVSPTGAVVSYDVSSKTAIFTPAAALTVGATYTATVTTAATDLAGNALAGNQAALPAASNYVWTFITAAAALPANVAVFSTHPTAGSMTACPNSSVSATFTVPNGLRMDPATLNATTFKLIGPSPATTPVLASSVALDPATGTIATFTPQAALAPNASYTATLVGGVNGVKDLALPANDMAADVTWTFTTAAATGNCLAPVPLFTASPFGDFGGTAGMTNMGILTVIHGDLGTIATANSSITGFHDVPGDIYTESGSNMGAVDGTIYTCTNSTTGPNSAGPSAPNCSIATQARLDAQTAYLALAAMPPGANPGGNLASLTLAPGVYTAPAGSFMIQGGDLTLDAQGNANAVFVFQMSTTLTVGGPGAAAPQSVILAGGAQAKNVFWQVGAAATINAGGGGTMVGTIISQAGASFSTSGNVAVVTLNGRALSLGASVTVVNTVINVPAP